MLIALSVSFDEKQNKRVISGFYFEEEAFATGSPHFVLEGSARKMRLRVDSRFRKSVRRNPPPQEKNKQKIKLDVRFCFPKHEGKMWKSVSFFSSLSC